VEQAELEAIHFNLRKTKKWGSFGKNGVNTIPVFYFIKDLGDSHIINILKTRIHLTIKWKQMLVNELIVRMNFMQLQKEETSDPCELNNI